MKAGKEAIIGAMAALDYRQQQNMTSWTADQDRKVDVILNRLNDIPGLELSVDPDPNGCPFSRARLTSKPEITGHTAATLRDELAKGNPTIVVRAHHAEEGYINIDSIEMTDEEVEYVCRRVREVLGV